MKIYIFSMSELEEHSSSYGDSYFGKCGNCDWETIYYHVLANSRESALNLILTQDAGLCGKCTSETISELEYEVTE